MPAPLISLATLPAYGHVFPLIPLAQALERAGARVQVTTSGDFLGRLPVPTAPGCDRSMKEAAIETVRRWPGVRGSSDGAVRFGAHAPERWVPAFFGVVLAEAAYRPLHQLWTEDRPDLVIYESMAGGAQVAADDLGIPQAMFAITSLPRMNDLSAYLRRHQAEPDVDPWTPLTAPGEDPATYIDPFPASFRIDAAPSASEHLELRPVAHEAPGSWTGMPESRPGRPLIYVTLGTVAHDMDVLRTAVTEAAGVGDVIVALGPGRDPADLGDVADGVHVFDFVPQATVLGRADLVVHHGGSGTTLAAAAVGVPQLLVPQGADQFANARAVARCGAGLALFPDSREDGDVVAALTRLRDEAAFTTSTRDLAAEIAARPSPDEVAATLLARLG